MEVSNGVVMKSRPCFYSGAGVDRRHRVYFPGMNRIPCELNSRESKSFARSLGRRVIGELSGFDEKGHVEYYNYRSSPVCGGVRKKEKEKEKNGVWYGVSEKKRAKLLKGLTKNLSMFSELGFGLQSDEAKGLVISEAADVLLAQLEHLRAEEKKLKLKESDMAYSQAHRMVTAMDDSESSSSSSESSDSECDDEVVNMSILRNEVAAPAIVGESKKSDCHESMATSPSPLYTLEEPSSRLEPKIIEEVGVVGLSIRNSERDCSNTDTSTPLKRIEVCMGGKCKKLGAQVLLDEFRNVLGVDGSVVECKCMGKCKTAPNVRVLNGAIGDVEEDDSIRTPSNPLFIGVGVEDVGPIVANYFAAEQDPQAGVGVSVAADSPSASV